MKINLSNVSEIRVFDIDRISNASNRMDIELTIRTYLILGLIRKADNYYDVLDMVTVWRTWPVPKLLMSPVVTTT